MSPITISGERISLHPKSKSDAPRDYIWSRDIELAALNGQAPLKGSYVRYLTQLKTISDDKLPTYKWLSIKTLSEEQHIGNCTIYNIDWDTAEAHVGVTIGERRFWGQGYGEDALKTLVSYAFHHLGMRRLHLKTLALNIRAQKCFRKCGFMPCGSLLEKSQLYILMQLNFENYVSRQLQ